MFILYNMHNKDKIIKNIKTIAGFTLFLTPENLLSGFAVANHITHDHNVNPRVNLCSYPSVVSMYNGTKNPCQTE